MITTDCMQRGVRMLGIQFKKLFGRFDYNVMFNPDGLTILTGPNGYGKSTILKSIEALGNEINGLMFFMRLDFEKITVTFKSQEQIVIEKKKDRLVINSFPIEEKKIYKLFDYLFERSYLVRINENSWFDRRHGEILTINELINNYETNMSIRRSFKQDIIPQDLSDVLRSMKDLVGTIYFIKEQRLIKETKNRRDEQEIINVIEELPKQFKDLMNSVQQDYSAVANELDSTYPNRLFETEEGITKEEYDIKIQEMASKFESLSKYDLATMQKPIKFSFKKEHAKALKVYFDDFEKKYKVYKDFVHKLDLYTDIINNRLSFKTIKISKESGISIIDENNKSLKLTQLSSGEKQEIVLFYDLIFRTDNDILLLIDEPEISLHITWQKKFMDDLIRIIDYKKFNVIVATHAPQIINNHWDKQIDLGELYGNQLDKR